MFTWMEHNILGIGRTISKMEKERKYGQIMRVIRDNIKMAKRTGEEHLNGQMDQCTLESLAKITFKELGNTVGRMEENILVIGKTTKWMEKEY